MATASRPEEFALRPLAEGIWTAEGPRLPALGLPIPVRMTAVRLRDGGLWLHSPIEARPGLLREARALGEVRHLVAPNQVHFSWLPDWAREAPEAAAWAAPGVRDRARRQGKAVDWAGDLGEDPPPDWAGTLDQTVVGGSRLLREVAFLHRPSRTLILTDLIQNFDRQRLPIWLHALARLGGMVPPHGATPPHLRATFTDRRALRASVERLIAWAPERIVMAHGRIIERDGTAALRRAFRWAL